MYSSTLFAASLGLLARLSSAQTVSDWGQCGGSAWTGSTQCGSGSGCVQINDYYSQCQPGAAPVEAATTLATSSRPSGTATPTTGTGGSTAAGPGTTLQSGYYWIRAVEAPNFHKYLQSNPLYSTGPAILGSYTTAGQFQVVDGQLVQLVSAAGATTASLLYGVVSQERFNNNQSLSVTWSTTKNSYGTFGWQGDGLTWSVPDIKRPNSIAWLVCANQQIFINLGNYNYQTPSGCVDETIHYYNDKTANGK